MTRGREIDLWLPALVALFLLWQLVLATHVTVAQYDEAIFLDVARNIRLTGEPLRSVGAEGKLFFDHTPLYIYLLGGLTAVLGDSPVALRLVTALFGVGTVLLLYRLTRAVNGRVAAVVATALLVLNPFFAVYTYFIRMEVPFALAMLGGAYCLWRAEPRGDQRWLGAAGLAVAAGVLFKEVGLTFWAAAVLYVVFTTTSWRVRLRRATLVGLPTLIGFALWLGYAYNLDAGRLQETVARWTGSVTGGAGNGDPRLGVAALAWLQALTDIVLGWETAVLLLLALLALPLTRRRPPRFAGLPLLYLALAVGASLLVTLKEPRHLIPIIPLGALAIGVLIDWQRLGRWAGATRGRLWLTILLLLGVAWSISPLQLTPTPGRSLTWWEPFFADRAFENDPYYAPIRAAGEYLATQTTPGEVLVVGRHGPVVGYYAGRPYIFLYTRDFAESSALLAGATYFVLDEAIFWAQTPTESVTLLAWVEANFQLERSFGTAERPVKVYRRH